MKNMKFNTYIMKLFIVAKYFQTTDFKFCCHSYFPVYFNTTLMKLVGYIRTVTMKTEDLTYVLFNSICDLICKNST